MARPRSDDGRPLWMEILVVAKGLSPEGSSASFSAAELAKEAALTVESKDTTPTQCASAWLSKFVRWGYAVRARETRPTEGRPASLYIVTKKGHQCELSEGLEAKATRLIEAVRQAVFQKTWPREFPAWKAIVAASLDVETFIQERKEKRRGAH